MAQTENTPQPEPRPDDQPFTVPENPVIRIEGVEDTTIRPSRIPLPPGLKQELANLKPGEESVAVLVEGTEDTTVRPCRPGIPKEWPRRTPPFPPLQDFKQPPDGQS